jgi:hypothetical protein
MLDGIVQKVQCFVTCDKLAAKWKAEGIKLYPDDRGWYGEMEGKAAVDFILAHRGGWERREDNFDGELSEISFYTKHTSIVITVSNPPVYPLPLGVWSEGMELSYQWFYGDHDSVSAFLARMIEDEPIQPDQPKPIEERVEEEISKLDRDGQLYELYSPRLISPQITKGALVYKLTHEEPTEADYGVPVEFGGGFTLYQQLSIPYGELLNLLILHSPSVFAGEDIK